MTEPTIHDLYKGLVELLRLEEEGADNREEIDKLSGVIGKRETAEMDRLLQESRKYHADVQTELAELKAQRLALQKGQPLVSEIRFWEVNGEKVPVLHINLGTPPEAERVYMTCKEQLESLPGDEGKFVLLRLLKADIEGEPPPIPTCARCGCSDGHTADGNPLCSRCGKYASHDVEENEK